MRPVLVPAEMAGRELMRRRTALALLTALPLAFYAAHASDGPEAIEVGGLTMAFSISDAVAKALPFWAPRRVLEFAAGEPLSAATMTSIALAWTAALLAAAAAISARRVRIARPARLPRRTQPVPERAASRQ